MLTAKKITIWHWRIFFVHWKSTSAITIYAQVEKDFSIGSDKSTTKIDIQVLTIRKISTA
jgi:hypothetical protein